MVQITGVGPTDTKYVEVTQAPQRPDTPTAMKAIRVHQFGGVETLAYEDLEQPVPAEGQVLVRVLPGVENDLSCVVMARLRMRHQPRDQ
jgi:hypothetical protein